MTAAFQTVRQMGSDGIDLSLYLVINPEQCTNANVVQTATSAAQGGVTAIQLRSKTMDASRLEAMVIDVADALGPWNIPVFVNDCVEVAASAGTGAVHLGQDDMTVGDARAVLGENACIGLTVHSRHEARNAPLQLLDYVSVGGVFPTCSKVNPDPPIGLDGLRGVVNSLRLRDRRIPIIAISGITMHNLESVLRCGVDGVAVVSAICESENPRLAAQTLRNRIDELRIRMETGNEYTNRVDHSRL